MREIDTVATSLAQALSLTPGTARHDTLTRRTGARDALARSADTDTRAAVTRRTFVQTVGLAVAAAPFAATLSAAGSAHAANAAADAAAVTDTAEGVTFAAGPDRKSVV